MLSSALSASTMITDNFNDDEKFEIEDWMNLSEACANEWLMEPLDGEAPHYATPRLDGTSLVKKPSCYDAYTPWEDTDSSSPASDSPTITPPYDALYFSPAVDCAPLDLSFNSVSPIEVELPLLSVEPFIVFSESNQPSDLHLKHPITGSGHAEASLSVPTVKKCAGTTKTRQKGPPSSRKKQAHLKKAPSAPSLTEAKPAVLELSGLTAVDNHCPVPRSQDTSRVDDPGDTLALSDPTIVKVEPVVHQNGEENQLQSEREPLLRASEKEASAHRSQSPSSAPSPTSTDSSIDVLFDTDAWSRRSARSKRSVSYEEVDDEVETPRKSKRAKPTPKRRVRGNSSDSAIGASANGERFPCPFPGCKETFSRDTDLSRHLTTVSVHVAESKIKCSMCGQSLSRGDAKKRHEERNSCGKRKVYRKPVDPKHLVNAKRRLSLPST
ncbi:hypothetical protein DXG03_006804 [Asterophora parasitica]|uniref:C2H2-type domain-containing protein n=1 Tax=Asterophora parasitica TaxID=117018 RepID=A0A9P7FYF3_9AGAR|nr:hypothetical protein DXG03_006804 [Asterophora parasitica]